jgi:hypothetical protein
VTALDDLPLPELDISDPSLNGRALPRAARRDGAGSWLARLPLGYLVLDREAGEHFLRSRSRPSPGR